MHEKCGSGNNILHRDSIRVDLEFGGLAEQILRDVDGGGSGPGDLKDMVDYWAQAIDRWIQRIDQGMGGLTDSADPALGPDSAPEAAPDPPALDAG